MLRVDITMLVWLTVGWLVIIQPYVTSFVMVYLVTSMVTLCGWKSSTVRISIGHQIKCCMWQSRKCHKGGCGSPQNLLFYIRTQAIHQMTFDRAQLVEDYIQQLIEGMDYKTMECLVYDTLKDNLSDYTDEQLITEVTEYNPELLEDVPVA